MKAISAIILVILVLLAMLSGITKIMLMQQEVDFFGKYGFSNSVLVAFGIAQALGGLLMIVAKSRFAGAAIVATTFAVSLALLLVEGNIPVSIVTLVAMVLLAVVMKQSWRPGAR